MVRVKYRNDVIKEFTKAMNGRDDFQDDMRFGDKFRGYKSVRQLQYILDPDRDIDPDVLEKLKKDILIESDPMSIKIFRARVWPAVRVNCATSACHGSAEGVGGLKLFNVSARDTRVAYTNFAILAGISTKKSARILDRDNIEDSLLLQYLLPATQAKTPHPKTKKPLRTLFRDNRHPTYKMFVKWIGSLAGPGYPNYNMKYKVPFGMKLELGGGGGALPDRPRDRK
jgi:hypothetical protein